MPAHQVGHISGPVHLHRYRTGEGAADQPRLLGQTFQPACTACAVLDHRSNPGYGAQGGSEVIFMRLGPGGIGLDHGHIPETVDDDTGKTVRFGMDQAVKRGREQPGAQGQGGFQTLGKPRLIDHGSRIAVQHPGDDLGFHIDGDQTQGAAVAILEHGKGTGGQALRPPVGDQFIRIDPGKAVPDRPRLGLGFQTDNGTPVAGRIVRLW